MVTKIAEVRTKDKTVKVYKVTTESPDGELICYVARSRKNGIARQTARELFAEIYQYITG